MYVCDILSICWHYNNCSLPVINLLVGWLTNFIFHHYLPNGWGTKILCKNMNLIVLITYLTLKVQKERELEGSEFEDKEVFVTSAYKKKLEEMRLEEEQEKREEYLESIGDVTKQKDLGNSIYLCFLLYFVIL